LLVRHVELLIALGLMAAYFVKGKVDTAKELEFFPKSLALSKDKKKLFLVIEVLNPTKRPLTIDSLFLKIFYGKTKVGSLERTEPIVIEATGRTMVKLPLRVDPVGGGKLMGAVLLGKTIVLRVLGIGDSMGLKFPVDAEIPFGI